MRGKAVAPLDLTRKWTFVPSRKPGERLRAGDVIGTVAEHRFTHKIMIPFAEPGDVELCAIEGGDFTVAEPVAHIVNAAGRQRPVTLSQEWPVRRPLPERLLRRGLCERRYPVEPLSTTIRLIDTFFPIALGGTACIPGPFGAGKTVLQGLIARFSTADVVIQVACGERAGEVLETIEEFAIMKDPRGGLLMDRTVVICNTSSMPVAAREASIYMGITLGEYYRQLGLNVLLIADSTSRWAQAMRETSGRLEEIPGEEGFPAYLDSSIKGAYERAGVLQTNDGSLGSLTMIGTVSPAGGNFDEPVTQSTLGTVKTFLGLSSARAYKRFYPAVDPLISWSRYLDQLRPYFDAAPAARLDGCGARPLTTPVPGREYLSDDAGHRRRRRHARGLCDLSKGAVARHGLPATGRLRPGGCLRAPGAPERDFYPGARPHPARLPLQGEG